MTRPGCAPGRDRGHQCPHGAGGGGTGTPRSNSILHHELPALEGVGGLSRLVGHDAPGEGLAAETGEGREKLRGRRRLGRGRRRGPAPASAGHETRGEKNDGAEAELLNR